MTSVTFDFHMNIMICEIIGPNCFRIVMTMNLWLPLTRTGLMDIWKYETGLKIKASIFFFFLISSETRFGIRPVTTLLNHSVF